MTAGIILIVSGVLIAVFPQLLSLIVASTLIVSGAWITYLGYRFKKAAREGYGESAWEFFSYR